MTNIYNLTLNFRGDVLDPNLGLAPIKDYIAADKRDADEKAKAKQEGRPAQGTILERLTPINHANPTFEPLYAEYNEGADLKAKTAQVVEIFKSCVENKNTYNSPFGKQLTVIDDVANKTLILASVADSQYILPAFAADFVPIIKGTKEGQEVYYFVGINRKFAPGAGKPATAGGFCNVKKPKDSDVEVFSSLIHTALSEGKQEIRSKIVTDTPLDSIKTNYDIREVTGKIQFEGEQLACKVVHTATLPTSNKLLSEGGEQIVGANGHKRVHVAASVGIYFEVPSNIQLDAEVVLKNFKANSDASDLVVLDVTKEILQSSTLEGAHAAAAKMHEELRMGIQHHLQIVQHGFYGAYQHYKGKVSSENGNQDKEIIAQQLQTIEGLNQRVAQLESNLTHAKEELQLHARMALGRRLTDDPGMVVVRRPNKGQLNHLLNSATLLFTSPMNFVNSFFTSQNQQ